MLCAQFFTLFSEYRKLYFNRSLKKALTIGYLNGHASCHMRAILKEMFHSIEVNRNFYLKLGRFTPNDLSYASVIPAFKNGCKCHYFCSWVTGETQNGTSLKEFAQLDTPE